MSDSRDRESRSEQFPSEPHLIRSLSLLDVIMVGIAAMIGGSIFVLTGSAIGLAGSAVIIAFIANAIITLFTAMAYAELGSAMPEAGGGYLWVREGLPRPNAFISGWMAWFAHIVAGSLYAVSFASFVTGLLRSSNYEIYSLFGFLPVDKLIAVLSIVAFTYLNIKGTSETGKVGVIVTIVQLCLIFVFIGLGIWIMFNNPDWTINFVDFVPLGITGIIAAMGLTFIAFEGYEVIVQTGEEVKNPKKNIPRAIFISLTAVVVLYCLIAFVSIGSIFPEEVSSWKFIGDYGELGIMKAAELIIPYGAFIILAGGMISTLAALNATTFSSARVAFAMGRHYNLPHKFSSIHKKNKTPYIAILLSGIIMAIMAYTFPLDQIAIAAGVIFLLLFVQVNMAVINIRRIYGDKLNYGFKMPFFPFLSIIGISLDIGLAIYLLITAPMSWIITLIWVALGFGVYRLYTFRKEIDHYAPIITSEGDLTRTDFRILIPYTPENPDRLIRYAINIAKANNGEINVLRTITVPHQTPLSAGVAFSERAKKSFEPLEKIIEEENIMNHYLVRISHDTNESILATIQEQKIDLMIIDYETLRSSKKLQALVTCDVLAIQTTGQDHFLLDTQNIDRDSKIQKKYNLVVLDDHRHDSDVIFKTIRWLETSKSFNINILSLRNKKINSDIEEDLHFIKPKKLEYLNDVKFESNEIYLSEEVEDNAEKLSDLILSAINASQPDLIITSSVIGKFNFFNNSHLLVLLDQLNCPVIVTKDFTIPVVHSAKFWLGKIFHNR